MNHIILANIFSLIGQLLLVFASTRKNKKQILLVQSISIAFVMTSSFLLKGYSGVVVNVLALIRNALALSNFKTEKIRPLFLLAAIILGYHFNNKGLLGYLPILANIAQTMMIMNKNAKTKHIQYALAFSSLCWAIFEFTIKSYVGTAFDIFALISYIRNILRNDADDAE